MQAVWETHLLLQMVLLEMCFDRTCAPSMQPTLACQYMRPTALGVLLARLGLQPGSGVLQVSRVLYPGLPDHLHFPRVQKLFGSQAGGVVTFELTGGAAAAEMMFQVGTNSC